MTTAKKRRVRPRKRPVTPPPRRRRPGKTAVNWKSGLIKMAVVIFVIVDLFLIYSFAQQCSGPVATIEPAAEPAQPVETKVLQVEVLNGCGVSGIAAKFTDFLRDAGFDVVKTDNYLELGQPKFDFDRSVVIDRRGDIKNAQTVAAALGIPVSEALSEPNDAYLVDVTVVLGYDYKQVDAWKKMETSIE